MSLIDQTFGGTPTGKKRAPRAFTSDAGSPIKAFESSEPAMTGVQSGESVGGAAQTAPAPAQQPKPYSGHHERMRATPDKITTLEIDGQSFSVGEWMAAIMNAGGFTSGGPNSPGEAHAALSVAGNIGRWGGNQADIPAAADMPKRKVAFSESDLSVLDAVAAQVSKFLSSKVQPAINAKLQEFDQADPFVKAMQRATVNFAALLRRAAGRARELSAKETEKYFTDIMQFISASQKWQIMPGALPGDKQRFVKLLHQLTPGYVGQNGELDPPNYNTATLDAKISQILNYHPELKAAIAPRSAA